jgi:hypothetical protein
MYDSVLMEVTFDSGCSRAVLLEIVLVGLSRAPAVSGTRIARKKKAILSRFFTFFWVPKEVIYGNTVTVDSQFTSTMNEEIWLHHSSKSLELLHFLTDFPFWIPSTMNGKPNSVQKIHFQNNFYCPFICRLI